MQENGCNKTKKDDFVKDNISTKAKEPGFWREIWQQMRLVFLLLRDPEVPFYLKFLPFLAVVYLFVPVDLVPDFLVGLGQLDDLTILLVGAKIFVELSPQHVVVRHMAQIRESDGYVIDAKVEDAIIIDGDYEPIPESKKDR